MKNFLKISAIIALIYYLYKYYKKNYTEEGKQAELQSNLDNIRDNEAIFAARGEELRIAWRSRAYSSCAFLESQSPFWSAEQIGWDCKQDVEAIMYTFNWTQIAEDEANGINTIPPHA